ncbi:MAG: proton-conducting transporter membrane subunit [Gemmatimonadota bacterium]
MPYFLDPLALLLVPAAAAAVALLLPRDRAGLISGWTAAALVVEEGLAVGALRQAPEWLESGASRVWLPAGAAYLRLGVDGLSFTCIALVPLLALAALVGTWSEAAPRAKERGAALLVTTAALQGVGAARDLTLFGLCLALAALGAAYLVVGLSPADQTRAGTRLAAYHLVATVLLLAATAVLQAQGPSAVPLPMVGALGLDAAAVPAGTRAVLLSALAACFAVPMALFPWHGWLAPVSAAGGTGALLVAGAWPLVGAYGFSRVCTGLLGADLAHWTGVATFLAAAAALLPALMTVAQPDLRRRLAWAASAFSGIVLLGLVSRREDAFVGALVLAAAQAPLRLGLALLASRSDAPGATAAAPGRLHALWLVGALALLGLPGSGTFAGLVLIGADLADARPVPGVVALAALGLVSAGLLLPYGDLHRTAPSPAPSRAVTAVTVAALAIALAVGLRPQPLVDLIRPAARSTLAGVSSAAAGGDLEEPAPATGGGAEAGEDLPADSGPEGDDEGGTP